MEVNFQHKDQKITFELTITVVIHRLNWFCGSRGHFLFGVYKKGKKEEESVTEDKQTTNQYKKYIEIPKF